MSRAGKTFLYLVYFAIVVVLSGFIIMSSKSNTPPAPKPPATSQHRSPAATPKSPKTTPSSPGQASANAGNAGSLSDTGPGNVAGLFVLATAAGAIAHRRILIKRAG
jgi:hypothetical protein